MGIFDPLKNAYFAFEDVYYDVVDFLNDKVGIPLKKFFVDPIESRGIPSFPVAVLLILAIVAFFFGSAASLLFGGSYDLTVAVVSETKPVKAAEVQVAIGEGYSEVLFTGPSGKAVFKNLPGGATIFISASKPGLQSADKTIQLTQSQVVSLQLQPVSKVEEGVRDLKVKVFDTHSVPLGGVKVEYYSLKGAQLGTKFSAADGSVKIPYDGVNPAVSMDFSKEGFQDKTGQVAYFSKKEFNVELTPVSEEVEEDEPKEAQLIVQVANALGVAVKSNVIVFDNSTNDELFFQSTGFAGQASFKLDFGSAVYVNVVALEGSYAPHYGKAFIVNDKLVIRKVSLQQKNVSFGKISLIVQDDQGFELENVEVTLYDSYSSKFLQSSLTDSRGKTSFDASNASLYHATFFKEGFLPAFLPGLKSGDSKTAKLKAASSNNSGNVLVTVFNAQDLLQEEAIVKLVRSFDGFALGIPSNKTNSKGQVFFKQVPSGVQLQALASKGARGGQSGSFALTPSSTENVSVKLERGKGNLTAAIRDMMFGNRVAGRISAHYANSTEISFCISQDTCVLSVPAGIPFVLNASAIGYEPPAFPRLSEIPLSPEESRGTVQEPIEIVMVPDEFSKNLFIEFTKVTQRGESATVTSVDRGREYSAHFSVHYPQNMSGIQGGFYVRLGGQGHARDTDFVITDADYTPQGQVNRKKEFFPQNYCVSDEDSFTCADEEGCKSIEFNYPVGLPVGVNQFKIHFKVRAESVSDNAEKEVAIHFRAYSNTNGSYLRVPTDLQLAENVDFCTANTSTKTYQLFPNSYCDRQACITLYFENQTAQYADGFETLLGNNFTTIALARQRQQLLGNVLLTLETGPHLSFKEQPSYLEANPLAAENPLKKLVAFRKSPSEFGVSTKTQAVHTTTTSNAVVLANLSSIGYEKIIYKFMKIQGFNPLMLTPSPMKIFVDEPEKITVKIENAFGVPITSAFVTGVINSSNELLAQNNTPAKNTYSLNIERPGSKRGWVKIYAQAGEDYGEVLVKVDRRNFLQATPFEINACNEITDLTIKNNGKYPDINKQPQVWVDVPLDCAHDTIHETVDADSEVGKYLFVILPNEQETMKLQPEPGENSCNIIISSSLSDGFAQSITIPFNHCSETPTLTPTPKPNEPQCTLDAQVQQGQASLTAIFKNIENLQPSSAALTCETSGEQLETSLENNKAVFQCQYQDAAQYAAKAFLKEFPDVKCTTDVTIDQDFSPAPTPDTNQPLPKIGFELNDEGVFATNEEVQASISALLPIAIINVSITNNQGVKATGLDLSFAEDTECFKVRNWQGNEVGIPDVDKSSTYFFPLTYGTNTGCPTFTSRGSYLDLTNPQKYPVKLSCTNCNSEKQTSTNFLEVTRAVPTSAKMAIARFKKDAFTFFSNNIQSDLKAGVMTAKIGSTEVKSGQTFGTTSSYSIEVPLGTTNGFSFSTESSPAQLRADVVNAISGAYQNLKSSLEGTDEQKTKWLNDVLNLPPNPVMHALVTDVGNGGAQGTVLHKYTISNYALSKEQRCNLNIQTGECETPCGAKNQQCCESLCFFDDLIESTIKEPNTRCYNNICNCGFIGQRACTIGKDSSQPHECVNSRAVRYAGGKCSVCGLVGLPPCDASRAGKTCFTGVSSGSGNCRLLAALSPGVSGAGSVGGALGPCGNPDTWCVPECVTVAGVPVGCDPADLNNELRREVDKAAQVVFDDYSIGLPGGANAYDHLKNLATSPQTSSREVETLEGFKTVKLPSGETIFLKEVSVDSINEVYDNMVNNDVEIDKECETGKFEGGVCVQKVGEEGILNHPEWCEDQQISPTTGKCCWSSGHGSANEANCCSGAHNWVCTIAGSKTTVTKAECDSMCASARKNDPQASCSSINTLKCK